MEQNRNYMQSRNARRLRRVEDKLDIIISDLNRMHTRLNWLQSQINSRNDLEMDMAINRLHFSAKMEKDMAHKELQEVRARYGVRQDLINA